LAARLTGVPLIVHSDHHGRFEPAKERKRWLYHILNRVVDPWTDAFVTVSHEQRAFHAEIGLPEQRMTVIHNGIDVNRFDSSQEARWSARQRLGLSLEAPIIGMTANFSVNKNHTLLLQALVKIRESIPNVHCLLIGDGPTRRSIESMTHQMGLAEAVSFLGIRSDLPDLLSALDVFVLTSLSESFSLAIVEAMACGKPVVATDSGGPKEIVLDGETGYLVPHEEPSVLAEKITLLLVSPVLAQRLGQAGRQRAVQYFSLDKMVAAREAFYLKLVSDKGIAAV
jgi:glycosyltransferase involved in cell wall biosynthesis